MENTIFWENGANAAVSRSLIDRLCDVYSQGLPFLAPVPALRANETELVQGVLQMLQGFSSSHFYWDDHKQSFHVKSGIYVAHLSRMSLSSILSQFVYAATCLKLVELFVKRVEISSLRCPTLKAFANSVSAWLKRLRDVALREEMKLANAENESTYTLLGLTNALSSLCSGAECLWQIVHGVIPHDCLDPLANVPASEVAVHILDHLYTKLNDVCFLQGGEEAAYHMLLVLFIGSLLPYIEGLDSWLYDGTLDDPYEELFFHANDSIAIDQPAFWEKSYMLRSQSRKLPVARESRSTKVDNNDRDVKEPTLPASSLKGKDQSDIDIICPLFLKDIANAILSAGKSLQLMRHFLVESASVQDKDNDHEMYLSDHTKYSLFGSLSRTLNRHRVGYENEICFGGESTNGRQMLCTQMGGLTLSEVFCVSLAGLIGDRSHIFEFLRHDYPWTLDVAQICKSYIETQKTAKGNGNGSLHSMASEKMWCRFLVDMMLQKRARISVEREKTNLKYMVKDLDRFDENKEDAAADIDAQNHVAGSNILRNEPFLVESFWPQNPAITVCREIFNEPSCNQLRFSGNFCLPPLNDENLRDAIFGGNSTSSVHEIDASARYVHTECKGTNYSFGFLLEESELCHLDEDIRAIESLFPFPTLLPCYQDLPISKLLPFQRNSTLASSIWSWLESEEPNATPLPAVIMKECLIVYIRKQVDYVGKHILLKLMNGWRLMDELGTLRAIYLLGSGDLLQQFLTVLFDKLENGDSWDDDFELNTVLQESIRNSADGMLLSTSESLVVTINKPYGSDDEHTAISVSTPRKGRAHSFGIDALDMLKFTYKVPWPLELIANQEAIKKYNQVMGFLLKVKRAKFVIDKARRWMWKDGDNTTAKRKHHLLVGQKLLHFVDAFHQYVMDRVFHSAWVDLCRGMSSAGSLDEVIEVHESYLLSVQRQCFVAPDKLWALIASRIKSILGLALDFYSIQQTLCSGGAAPATKVRCEMEVDRIEKQFDDCIAFLLRVLSFKLNVGHFPHLADLVTRINYNYFYMSENGNLLTVPTFDASSKMGKSFPVRTDS